jgi:hypothetical protein
MTTLYAGFFAIRGNTITKVSGDSYWTYQLVRSDPLTESTTIKVTIKKYGGKGLIAFGLLVESRRN